MARAVPLSVQQSFWNRWNESHREESVDEVSARQAEVVCRWLEAFGRRDLNIIEVGCGTGWFCPQLTRFGRVTGTDLSDEVLNRAKARAPAARFVPGDFMTLDLGSGRFDVAVTLEVLSHVEEQQSFVGKIAKLLRPGGYLMLATQNRPVLQYLNSLPPPAAGQVRRWVDRRQLRALLEPYFEVRELFSVTPRIGQGLGLGLGLMRRIRSLPLARTRAGIRTGERRPILDGQPGGTVRRPPTAERCLEALGLGWTLMASARKRASG